MVLAVDEVVLDAAASGDAPTPEQHAELAVDFVLHALAADRRRIAAIRAQLARQRATRLSPPPA
jgi:hypothetical protein